MDRPEYRTTDIERWLADALATMDSTLQPPTCEYRHSSLPPDPKMPILTRRFAGPIEGAYHRYVNAVGMLPLSIDDRVRRLEGYPGVLEADIVFEIPPRMHIMTEFRNNRSKIVEVRLDHPDEHALFYRLARTHDLPFADSIEVLAKGDPEAFIRGLGPIYRIRGPNAYNASS
jgi:hypothetical protein